MKKCAQRITVITLIMVTLTTAAYVLAKKFFHDRTQALLGNQPPITRKFINNSGTTTRTYTQKEIDEARKKGTPPVDIKQPYMPPTQTGDEAVQRSLKTIEEINKINEMNQRLIDQQRRLQNK